MKIFFALASLVLAGQLSQASVGSCQRVAERAAYQKWNSTKSSWSFGEIQSGATSVVWVRGGVISYQVSVQWRKPDSSEMKYAHYSVRTTENDCRVLKVRGF